MHIFAQPYMKPIRYWKWGQYSYIDPKQYSIYVYVCRIHTLTQYVTDMYVLVWILHIKNEMYVKCIFAKYINVIYEQCGVHMYF